jgi:hypothetical protein
MKGEGGTTLRIADSPKVLLEPKDCKTGVCGNRSNNSTTKVPKTIDVSLKCSIALLNSDMLCFCLLFFRIAKAMLAKIASSLAEITE